MLRVTQKIADRYLVGRTIASVSVTYLESDHHEPSHCVTSFLFTDGSGVSFSVEEHECEYAVVASRHKPG